MGSEVTPTIPYRTAPRRRFVKGTLALWQREARGGLKAAESGLLALW